MSTCRSCGQKIKWVTLTSGKHHPCDPDLVHPEDCEIGNKLVTEAGEVIVIKETNYAEDGWGYVSHFSTCPFAEQHRRK